jgi:type I restriction enzyme S subunit
MTNSAPLVPLAEICERTERCDPTQKPDQVFRYIDISSISNQLWAITEARNVVGRDAPSRAKKRIRTGDVIVATTRPYLKAIALVPAQFNECVCSTGFCVLRARNGVLPEWIFYAVRSQPFMEQLLPKMRGASYPAVTDGDVRECKIPDTKPGEQRRVVSRIRECLSRVEEMQRLREEAEAESDLIETRFLAEVEQSLADCVTPMRELLLETQNGKALKNKETAFNCRVLTLTAVRTHVLDLAASKPAQMNGEGEEKYLIRPGDVFISRSNTRELVALSAIAPDQIEERTIFSDLLIRLTPNRKAIRPLYLVIALRMPRVRDQLRANAIGSSQTMVKISGERLRTVELPCPSLAEQQRIEEKFAKVSAVTSTIRGELASGAKDEETLRESILREAFAGNL